MSSLAKFCLNLLMAADSAAGVHFTLTNGEICIIISV